MDTVSVGPEHKCLNVQQCKYTECRVAIELVSGLIKNHNRVVLVNIKKKSVKKNWT